MNMKPTVLYIATAILAIVLVLSACGDRNEVQTEANTPAAQEPAAPVVQTPPALPAAETPDRTEQLQDRLAQLGAATSAAGPQVTLTSAKFEPGQTDFQPADAVRIDRIAETLKEMSEVQVLVQGYTDNRGGQALNQQLSRARAESVQHALIERGVSANRIRVEGLGEAHPIASNETAEGREQNRRVSIVFSGAEGRFAAVDTPPPLG